VGALTAVDFRFKARVWFLRSVRSVCVGCATGCNSFTDYDPRSQKVYRYRPRQNLAVNKYWMCDEGMLDYRRINDGRVLAARSGKKKVDLERALDKAATHLEGVPADSVAVVLSAEHSNEDNYALLKLARDGIGTGHLFVTGRPPGPGDEILRHTDKNPNAKGVTALCTTSPPQSFAILAKSLEEGRISHVIALGSQVTHPDRAETLSRAKVLIALSTHEGPLAQHATVTLPAASWAEADGTFVNAKGMAQLSERAVRPPGDSQPAWKLVALLARKLGVAFDWQRLSDLRREMAPEPGAALPGDAAKSSMGASA
jgi:NADH-quinone oxidoreductase subunit G